MSENITQRQLANLLDLSYPTVNRALNGSPGIHARTRRRIIEAAERLGYSKNIVARNLVLGRTHSIGMIITNNPHSFWSTMLANLEAKGRETGYHVILCHSGDDSRQEDDAINFLVERQVDGLILVPHHLRTDFSAFHQLAQKRVPLLFLGSYLEGINTSFLGLDDIGGSILACRHLINLGHKRIAFVAGPEHDSTSDRRLAGYRQAMEEVNLRGDNEIVVRAEGFYIEDGIKTASQLLDIKPRPTAVLAMNDPLAFGVSQIFRERGIRIPQDIAIIGNAGMPEGALLPTPLTTVAPPTATLGQRAAEIIIKMIESKRPHIVSEELKNELLIRASCGAASAIRASRKSAHAMQV